MPIIGIAELELLLYFFFLFAGEHPLSCQRTLLE